MKKLFLLMSTLACLTIPALAAAPLNYVTVYGNLLRDSSGNSVANATISFAPENNNGAAISFEVGGGGQTISRPVTALVTNGAFTLILADTALTEPGNVCYAVTLTDNVSGKSLLSGGYSCVQPAGSGVAVTGPNGWCTQAGISYGGTCDFDNYLPNLAALIQSQYGPTGPTGPTGATGPAATYSEMSAFALSYGASPSATLSGSNPYSVAFGIPSGAPGAGSGTVGTSVNGAPVAANPTGTNGGTSNTVSAGAGPWNVAGLMTNSSTDNTSVLQAAINAGHQLVLPENCASGGNINVAGPLTYGSGLNAPSISGGGWHSQLCQTNLLFTSTSYATGAINLATGNAVGHSISDLNIGAAPGVTITSGAAIYSDAPGTSNYQHFDHLQIEGFPQSIVFNDVGNVDMGLVYLGGTPASAGLPLFQWTGAGANSNRIMGITGGCGSNDFNAATGVTLFSFGTPTSVISGRGNEFHFHDAGAGCATVVYQNGGYATYFFANGEEREGPVLDLASGSATAFWQGDQSQMYYLGPPFILGTSANLNLTASAPVPNSIPSLTVQSQSASGGSYAAGTYYFFYEADGPLNVGTTSVNLNSPVSSGLAVTFASGSANEVTLNLPVASGSTFPIVGATSYTIWRNTTNSAATASEIATGVTGSTYLSTNSETLVATAPPVANVPLILQGHEATVTANCTNNYISFTSPNAGSVNLGQMAIDEFGRYFNPCIAPEIAASGWAWPAANQGNSGRCYQVLPAPGVAGQDALYCNLATTTSAGTTYQWVNEWANQGTLTYTSSLSIGAGSPSPSVIQMNCTATCAVNLHAQPYTTWCSNIVSVGSTLATVALGSSQTWDGGTTPPTLTTGKPIKVCVDSATSNNFIGG